MTFTKKDASQRLFLWPLYFLLFCTALPAIGDAACSTADIDESANVHYIHDGDTLRLGDGRKVRLIGINTPELARDNRTAEAYASESKNALKSLFNSDKSIKLLYGKDKKDRYGRLLAHALLSDGRNVQALLLKQGYASAIIIPPNTRFATCYLEMEHQARCKRAGLWQSENILQAKRLEDSDIGFHLVQGKVLNIDISDKGTWLNIDNKLTVGIRPENRSLFDLQTINNMLNQIIIVRGWLNKSKRSTPYYLRVRHPLSIQMASALSCH